jgi:hypothetical protein
MKVGKLDDSYFLFRPAGTLTQIMHDDNIFAATVT